MAEDITKFSPDEKFSVVTMGSDLTKTRINQPVDHGDLKGIIVYCLYSRRPVAECKSRNFMFYSDYECSPAQSSVPNSCVSSLFSIFRLFRSPPIFQDCGLWLTMLSSKL